jgi:hypothetical protein
VFREEFVRKIEAEMLAARQARAAGKEGRARVCARRAAGHAIRGYREAIGLTGPDHSAYFLLHWIASLADVDHALRASAERLAARVTPDHVLPHPQDPLADANLLIEGLLRLLRSRATASESKPGDDPGRAPRME